MTRLRAVLALMAVSGVLAGCGDSPDQPLLGTLERDRLELTAEASEPILGIDVHEGDAVKAGAALVRLDPAAAQARMAGVQARVLEARRRLAELVQGPRREQILAARATVEGASARVLAESREMDRVQSLVQSKMVSASALDRQRAARDSAEADKRRAEAEWQLLVRGTRVEQLDQARAALDAVLAEQASLQLAVDRLTLRAPVDGTVDALPYEQGERPPVGAPLVVLLASGQPYARVYLPEPLRAGIKAGSKAEVAVDGLERRWAAEVRYVSGEAAFTPYYALTQKDRQRLGFLAELVLTDKDAATLPAGVPVEVRIGPGQFSE
ncbi:MAG: HlyD family efflux transporter periplasmic adaptor subunit [Steroidobacteraceae bacterium]|nr:HlyD family efflux transporter periplasmic adaptor subunit [Steroidobacteraceae bacterium]